MNTQPLRARVRRAPSPSVAALAPTVLASPPGRLPRPRASAGAPQGAGTAPGHREAVVAALLERVLAAARAGR